MGPKIVSAACMENTHMNTCVNHLLIEDLSLYFSYRWSSLSDYYRVTRSAASNRRCAAVGCSVAKGFGRA